MHWFDAALIIGAVVAPLLLAALWIEYTAARRRTGRRKRREGLL